MINNLVTVDARIHHRERLNRVCRRFHDERGIGEVHAVTLFPARLVLLCAAYLHA